MEQTDILINDGLWLQASQLCEYAYSLLDDFPDEERWGMQSALRKHAFSLSNDIAESIAGEDPRNTYHALNYASRDLFGLKNCLTMAKRAKIITPDPHMMLTIEKLAGEVTKRQEIDLKNIQPYLKRFDRDDSDGDKK